MKPRDRKKTHRKGNELHREIDDEQQFKSKLYMNFLMAYVYCSSLHAFGPGYESGRIGGNIISGRMKYSELF